MPENKKLKKLIMQGVEATMPFDPMFNPRKVREIKELATSQSIDSLGRRGASSIALFKALELACEDDKKCCSRKKVYLAAPYIHDNKKVMNERAETIEKKTAELIKSKQIILFSPITYTHEMAKKYCFPTDYKFWLIMNHAFLDWADELWVFRMPGWNYSQGVNDEISYAEDNGIPIKYID